MRTALYKAFWYEWRDRLGCQKFLKCEIFSARVLPWTIGLIKNSLKKFLWRSLGLIKRQPFVAPIFFLINFSITCSYFRNSISRFCPTFLMSISRVSLIPFRWFMCLNWSSERQRFAHFGMLQLELYRVRYDPQITLRLFLTEFVQGSHHLVIRARLVFFKFLSVSFFFSQFLFNLAFLFLGS